MLHFLLLKDCVLRYFSVVCVTLLVIGLCVHDPEYKPCFMDRPLTNQFTHHVAFYCAT